MVINEISTNSQRILGRLAISFALFVFLFFNCPPLLGVSSTRQNNVVLSFSGHGSNPPVKNSPQDVLEGRLVQATRQLGNYQHQINAYAASIRKTKLENSKFLRVFMELSHNFSTLDSFNDYLDPVTPVIGVDPLKQYENRVYQLIKDSRDTISEAKEAFDSRLKIQRLKDKILSLNDILAKVKKEGEFFSLTAAKVIPRSLHCLALRLMQERSENPDKYVNDGMSQAPEFEDPSLYHYALFSDNVLAASVVVNSLVHNAEEPSKHVIHVVTDRTNFEAMRVLFRLKEYNGAHIEVKAVEDYKFVNSSYMPVLRQAESAILQKFYSGSRPDNLTENSNNMKFRNPKYLSVMNHIRFYLPEMYPALHKILFLDDDIVVQKDLTGLWKVDMDGKVNGAVYTCLGKFHRLYDYLNFSNPLIKDDFDPEACAWAYGMNLFDLEAWRREKCTEEYHFWQDRNEDRFLWKLGTLPVGLITFYKRTKGLDKSWHVLGLGYKADVRMEDIRKAAVVHYNGNLKPWLDTAVPKFRPIWEKYVDYDFIRECNSQI